jgi:Mrp family chromosome partitioning ATPase/capsular polysaccharide biosynthesis protein
MTTNSPLVQAGQVGLDSVRAEKEKMEAQWPTLLSVRTDSRDGSQTGKVTPQEQLFDTYLKADGLSARISTLSNELSGVQSNITMVNNLEASTAGLRRTTEVEEAAYKHWLESVDKARISNAMGPGRVSNIGEVESPTPPARDRKMIMKVVGGTLFGGLALAFGLPFLLELYFNRTFRHPEDVHLKLDLPLLVSIPKTNGHKRLLAPASAQLALPASKTVGGGAEATEEIGRTMVNMPDTSQLEPWSRNHALQPYFETLRDGLISYFEMLNLTHKPKLVAVTSCGVGAGVTTTAAGLAASLSETGDGNVLLVNMNSQDGEAHHFYKGKLSCGLDEVLEKEKRGDAQVQDNLYVAKNFASNDSLPRTLPKRFSHLVPKMKASDFDYIIFDMPPISQISITARLSRFMDMVLMVVESERTDLETAKRAAQCLVETKTNVGVILNKTRSYVPKRLWHEM